MTDSKAILPGSVAGKMPPGSCVSDGSGGSG
jgi:hypothetical protein